MILCVCPNPSIDTLITVDDFAPRRVHRARKEERFPGGKGVHVALAAAELGAEVTLLAFWAGATGQWIRDECEKLGADCVGQQINGWSRSCITLKSAGEYNETELLGIGPDVKPADIAAFEALFRTRASSAKVVTMSGSWPRGAGDESYSRLLKNLNRPVMLDFAGESLKLALNAHPQVVHLNQTEAREMTGEADPAAAAKILARQGKPLSSPPGRTARSSPMPLKTCTPRAKWMSATALSVPAIVYWAG
jgi:fructose-1-phosphate kinase PfkB-like protein